MLLGGNDSRVLLTPRIKPSQALYYQLSRFDIPSGQRHMADLTEFLKRERGISELCFAGLGFKGPFFSLLPPHALSALPSVRKYIDSFPPDGVCVGPGPWNAACFHGGYMEPSQEPSMLGRGQSVHYARLV